MIKKFKDFINEDFTDLYKRWKNKDVRKENGTIVKTKYGEILLKEPKRKYQDLIQMILNIEDEDMTYIDVIQNMNLNSKERNDIFNYKNPYIFPLEDLTHGGLVIVFMTYEEALDVCQIVLDEEFCEDDYNAIIKCIALYLKDNVKIARTNIKSADYKLLLYSGEYPEGLDRDMNKEDFEEYYNTEINVWSFRYETNIGVDINQENIDNYADMKKEVESWKE